MWNTAKNSVFISIISFPTGILLLTLPGLAAGQPVEWEKWILYGLSGSLLFGMLKILIPIKHGLLRLLLWANGSIPWNYAAFLDRANKLRLIQSMGGRYRFVHDLLREEMIGATPLARRLASTPDWIKYLGLFVGLLVAISAGNATKLVSSKLAQVTMPILQTGDLVFFDTYSYHFTDPQRYDLVSFRSAGSEDLSREWIVGLPGETISSQGNQLLVNGNPIDRPYTHFSPNFSIEKTFIVPAQSYFVVGKAIDKNGEIVPTRSIVHRKQLTGRWLWRLWPLHRFGAVK
jgi:signal peptidase I